VYVQRVRTGERRQVSARAGINGAPSWSPDGRRLAPARGGSGGNGGSADAGGGSGPDRQQTAGGGSQAAAGSGAGGEPIVFPLKEKITLRIDAYKPPSNAVADYNEYEIFQELEKRTNVHIEWTVHDNSTKTEKLNLMAASGEYPDAIYGAQPDGYMLSSWAEQGIAIPLNDLIDKYAPNLKRIFEENPKYREIVTHGDGKIYSLPIITERPFNEAPDTMFINKKWLDKAGLPLPATMDELYEALKAFKDADMNENGINDEIPMSFLFRDHWRGGHSLAMAWDVMDHMYTHTYIKDGEVLYAPMQEGYRKYAEFMHKLYKEGLLDPELFTQDANVYRAKIRGEFPILGVAFYSSKAGFSNTDDYVPLIGLKGPDGHAGWTWDRPGIQHGGFVITSANKHPEITMAWIDSHYDFEMSLQLYAGPFGKGINKISDNKYEPIPLPQGMNVYAIAPEWPAPKYIPARTYTEDIFVPPNDVEQMNYFFLKQPYLKYTPPKYKIYDTQDYEKLDTINEINSKNGYIDQTFADFVINGVTDEKWNSHLQQLKKFGIEEYLQIVAKYE